MRIERLTFKEHDSGWELTPTEFFPGVTLLVGASGVGKTRVLRALQTLKAIADDRRKGMRPSGVEWDFVFSLEEGRQFNWSGQFAGINGHTSTASLNGLQGGEEDLDAPPRIIKELLSENGIPLIERDADVIRFDGSRLPKLSPHTSCLNLLSHEAKIAPAHRGLAHVLTTFDYPEESRAGYVCDFSAEKPRYPTLEAIRASTLPTLHKLGLIIWNATDEFQRIVQQYREIFPSVEALAIRMEPFVEYVRIPGSRDQQLLRERVTVQLKEIGCSSWIPQERISSGMWRTLMHLARLALWPDGTVVLIDEFENSLGVNCLDAVTEYLNDNSRRLQFIVTSHHPYIINNISPRQWKMVSRNGGTVTTRNAEDVGIGKSRHEAFFQLINNKAYREGITVP